MGRAEWLKNKINRKKLKNKHTKTNKQKLQNHKKNNQTKEHTKTHQRTNLPLKKVKPRRSKPYTYFTLLSLTRLISLNRKLTHTYTNTQNAAYTIIQSGFHEHDASFLKWQSTKKLQRLNLV